MAVRLTEGVLSLSRILDHIDDVTKIDDIRLGLGYIGPMYGVPTGTPIALLLEPANVVSAATSVVEEG